MSPTFTLISLQFIIFLLFSSASASDYTNFIFKGCASQTFDDPTSGSLQNLKSLFGSLLSQSSSQSYYATNSSTISGLFQCRGDLSSSQCSDCVAEAQSSAAKLCKSAIASRIQLAGCYIKYQVSGFKEESGSQLLFKVCGSNQETQPGFDGLRAAALGIVVSGIQNGNLFYTGSYQTFYVLGQCEGDLSAGDCNNCINTATAAVKGACGGASFGQVYLNRCYVSYSNYAGKVPKVSSSSSAVSGDSDHTQRTVAIAVGGVAALGLLFALLLCVRSLFNRRRYKHDEY